MSSFPPNLVEIINFFSALSSEERRENLIAYADQVDSCAPDQSINYDLEDVRKDQECTDTVGIFVQLLPDNKVNFAVSLGPQVQTLTRAMTSILCQGLNGSSIDTIIEIEQSFVTQIIGAELVRVRSQTVYYVLSRMKSAAKVLKRRLASK